MSNFRILITIIFIISTTQKYFTENNFHSNLKNNCQICHVNQNNINENPFTPLWINNLIEEYYIPYESSSLDANVGQPSNISKMCLSCHDGTIASDDNSGITNESYNIVRSGMNYNHPISFTYDFLLAQKDRELYIPETTPSGLGNTIRNDLLIDGKMECISCHNPHETRSDTKMLLISNEKSKLCLTCHIK